MAKQTGSMRAGADDCAVLRLVFLDCGLVTLTVAPTLLRFVATADQQTPLACPADRYVPETDRVPALTWSNLAEADPVE